MNNDTEGINVFYFAVGSDRQSGTTVEGSWQAYATANATDNHRKLIFDNASK